MTCKELNVFDVLYFLVAFCFCPICSLGSSFVLFQVYDLDTSKVIVGVVIALMQNRNSIKRSTSEYAENVYTASPHGTHSLHINKHLGGTLS